MTFHGIVRQWCKLYRPIHDDEIHGNRRFFLTDSTAGVIELAKNIKPAYSPCVVMESNVEGDGPVTMPVRCYPVYFFVRAKNMSDGDSAAEAKEEAWVHAQNFVAWLLAKHNQELESNINGDFARIDLEQAYSGFQTVGPLEDGWFAVLMQFDRLEPVNTCLNKDLYLDPCNC
jgi:hypothetical protein